MKPQGELTVTSTLLLAFASTSSQQLWRGCCNKGNGWGTQGEL